MPGRGLFSSVTVNTNILLVVLYYFLEAPAVPFHTLAWHLRENVCSLSCRIDRECDKVCVLGGCLPVLGTPLVSHAW